MKTTLLTSFQLFLSSVLVSAQMPATRPAMHKPLLFIENKGQVKDQDGLPRPDIQYRIAMPGLNVFVGSGQIHYQFAKTARHILPHTHSALAVTQTNEIPGEPDSLYRMDVTLMGANVHAAVVVDGRQEYYERYYTAPFGEEGAIAHSYQKITYTDVYPHIDWVLYIKDNYPEYDFIVHPGGDPAMIKLRYDGATDIQVTQDGNLAAYTPMGKIEELKPYSYELGNDNPIATSFVLKNNLLAFKTAPHKGTLIIDPKLDWATYFGGNTEDGQAVALDTANNVYMTGSTYSSNNIATTGAYQTIIGGSNANNTFVDAFIAKFNSSGNLLWATYFGGNNSDYGNGIACDMANNVYVSGGTYSSNYIATTGSMHTAYAAGADGFLAKFNSSGAIQWATYIGGAGADAITVVKCDKTGNIFVCGATTSDTGIATSAALYPDYARNIYTHQYRNGFIQKYNAAGGLQWGSYYPGEALALACDSSGNVYMGGSTADTSDIATIGCHQGAIGSNSSSEPHDGYLVKFTNIGTRLWGTYYGGYNDDYIAGLVCDKSGNLYICGMTLSNNNITTTGSYQDTIATAVSANFIGKFNSSGTRQWATYYYNQAYYVLVTNSYNSYMIRNAGPGIHCDNSNNIYFSYFSSSYSPTSWHGFTTDGRICAFSSNGAFEWDTTLSGIYNTINNIVCDSFHHIYIAGSTAESGIATVNAYQTSIRGNNNAVLFKLAVDTLVYIVKPFRDTSLCAGSQLLLPFGVNYNFRHGNIFTAQLSDASGSFSNPVNIGTDTVSNGDTIICHLPGNTPTGYGYKIRIIATSPVDTSASTDSAIHIYRLPMPTYSSNGPLCPGDTLKLQAADSAAGAKYIWQGPFGVDTAAKVTWVTNSSLDSGNYYLTTVFGGCTLKNTLSVTVKQGPNPIVTYNNPLCLHDDLYLTVSGNSGRYIWHGPNGFLSSIQSPVRANVLLADSGYYVVTVSLLNTCSKTDSIKVAIKTASIPDSITFGGNTPLCEGDTLRLTSASTTKGVSYSWAGPARFYSTAKDTIISNVTVANAGNYYIFFSLNGCPVKDTVKIAVNPKPVQVISGDSVVCLNDSLHLAISAYSGAIYNWQGPAGYHATTQYLRKIKTAFNDSGRYIATTTLNGCTSLPDTVMVSVRPAPLNVVVTGGPVCLNDTIRATVSSTSKNVVYTWAGPSSFAARTQNIAVPNAGATTAGNYIAAVSLNGCTVYDTVNVTLKPLPDAPSVGSNSPVCEGATLIFTANSTTNGVSYQWNGPGGYASPKQNITIYPANNTHTGIYTVTVTSPSGCRSSGAIPITIKPLAANPSAVSNSPVCTGQTLNLAATSTSSGVTYRWWGPGGFTATQQNISITGMPVAGAGIYMVSLELNGCTDTISVPVSILKNVPDAAVSIKVSPKDTLCTGGSATFSATPVNGGTAPTYQWKKNGTAISGANGSSYTATGITNGDVFTCILQSNAICQAGNIAYSNAITMHMFNPVPAMIVTVVSSPASYTAAQPVTFTANVLNAGSSRLYFQWENNGIAIPGATINPYTTSKLKTGDKVTVVVRSDAPCRSPDSTVGVTNAVGIEKIAAGNEQFIIYPNPTTDYANIRSLKGTAGRVMMTISDLSGRILKTETLLFTDGNAILQLDFPAAVYLVQLVTEDGTRDIERLVIY